MALRLTHMRGFNRVLALRLLMLLCGASSGAAVGAQDTTIDSATTQTGTHADVSAPKGNDPQSTPDRKTVDVAITGISGEMLQNVRLHLGVFRLAQEKRAITARSARKFLKDSSEEITVALQAFGYYQSDSRSSLEEGANWKILIEVDAGPAAVFRDILISFEGEGRNEASLQKILQATGVQKGEAVLHQSYSDLKSALQKKAYDLGYLDASFAQHTLRVFPEQLAADVHLVLDTGDRYYFGPISMDQEFLNADFVQRFITVKEGDAFESSRLIDMQLALADTNYFSQVDMNFSRENAVDSSIPVSIQSSPAKASRYSFRLGYGTDTGPRAGAGTDFRRVNYHGHRFSSELQVSEVHSSLASRYSIPIGDVRSESLNFTLHAEKEDINSVDSTEYRLGTSLNQNWLGGARRLSLDLVHENWNFGDGPNNEATLLIPGIDFSYKNADDPFLARRGYSYTLQLRGAAEDVVSDVSFGQALLFGRAVLPLAERSRLLLRAEYGATVTDAFNNLPPSLRFFAGGSQSVRGYGYKDLSPRDDQDNRIGGKYFVATSLEVDYLVYDNMGFAAFIDAGDATRDPIEELKVGAGLGFRYRSPVGMLRIDVAHPFDDPKEDFRIHISFGADL